MWLFVEKDTSLFVIKSPKYMTNHKNVQRWSQKVSGNSLVYHATCNAKWLIAENAQRFVTVQRTTMVATIYWNYSWILVHKNHFSTGFCKSAREEKVNGSVSCLAVQVQYYAHNNLHAHSPMYIYLHCKHTVENNVILSMRPMCVSMRLGPFGRNMMSWRVFYQTK